jgi:predicted transposase/invertase (TIGR01784 family)
MAQEKDKFFKMLFQHKFVVQEFLKYLVSEDWVDDLDFSTLEVEKTDYKSIRMANRANDLAWKVKYKGEDIYIVIHLEVQVANDNRMPIRFLEYIGYFYDNKYKNLKKEEKIVPIIPILLYIGSENWNAKSKFHNLVNFTDDRLSKYIINFEYFPVILKDISKNKLVEANSIFTRLLSLSKSENKKDFVILLNKLFETVFTFKDINQRKRLKELILLYVEETLNIKNKYKILDIIDNFNMEEDMYSLSLKDVFEKEDQENIEKGIKQGIERIAKKR